MRKIIADPDKFVKKADKSENLAGQRVLLGGLLVGFCRGRSNYQAQVNEKIQGYNSRNFINIVI